MARFAMVLSIVACRDHEHASPAHRGALESAITRDLTAKLGEPVTATCAEAMSAAAICEAVRGDGTKIPIAVASEGKDWAWHVTARVVETAPIAAYIDQSLADLKVAQHADCGPRGAVVERGSRLACKLTGGGMAFVRFANDGTASLELALDAATAAARGEVVTPERDRELTRISRALEGLAGESDADEEVVAPASDGGLPKP